MAVEKFKLSILDSIDGGRIRASFEQHMQRLQADCRDRPSLTDKRTLTLTLSFTPVADPEARDMESCDVRFELKSTVPVHRSKTYNMKSTPAGLLYNELSPNDIHQRTLDEAPRPERLSDAQ